MSRSVDGTVTHRYLWADATHLLAVCDGAGAVQARFLYADARVPYAADTPSGRRFLHYDQVGSLRAVTDTSASLIRTIERDSFGVVLSDTDTASPVPIGFAGGLADPDTGLVLFGARDYDPALGRWCAKDPIGFAGGDANLYGYCVGDPVGLADPAGLMGATTNYVPDGVWGTGGYGRGIAGVEAAGAATWSWLEANGPAISEWQTRSIMGWNACDYAAWRSGDPDKTMEMTLRSLTGFPSAWAMMAVLTVGFYALMGVAAMGGVVPAAVILGAIALLMTYATVKAYEIETGYTVIPGRL